MEFNHQEFLEEIITILTEYNEETTTPEEVMRLISDVVEDYNSELSVEKSEKEERDNLKMMGVEESSEDENSKFLSDRYINRDFLLAKASDDYYKKLGFSEDEFDELSQAAKAKHRRGVTALFNEYLENERKKPSITSKYDKNPFKRQPGTLIVNRKSEIDDEEENDDNLPAAIKWKAQKKKELTNTIKSLTYQIDELKRRNKIEKISAYVINLNNDEIMRREEQLEDLKNQLSQYK